MADTTRPTARPRAIVRAPGPRLAGGLVTHVERSLVDVDLARTQWRTYVTVMADHGWDIIEVEPAPDHPDAVFVEDTAVVWRDLAVITRPGAPQRRRETVAVAATLDSIGLRTAAITPPGTLDGGDVMKVGSDVWVGRGDRTNQAGVDQLAALLEPEGATVRAVDVTRVLHLKSAVTALPDGTVVGHEPLVDDPAAFADFLPVPEAPGAHVITIAPDTVMMATGAPATASLLRARGIGVVTVDISEFEKLEGCVTCLSIRLRPRAR